MNAMEEASCDCQDEMTACWSVLPRLVDMPLEQSFDSKYPWSVLLAVHTAASSGDVQDRPYQDLQRAAASVAAVAVMERGCRS